MNKSELDVLKEKKYYFWDWGILEEPGKRLENFTAVHLQRAVSAWREWGKGEYDLKDIRRRDGKGIDFVITEKEKPLVLIECKMRKKSLQPGLLYLKNWINAPIAFQVINEPGYIKQIDGGVFIMGTDRILQILP